MKIIVITIALTATFIAVGCSAQTETESTDGLVSMHPNVLAYRDSTGLELGGAEALAKLRILEGEAALTPGVAATDSIVARSGGIHPLQALPPGGGSSCSVSGCIGGTSDHCSVTCTNNRAMCYCGTKAGAGAHCNCT
jgi:hypothetical protein